MTLLLRLSDKDMAKATQAGAFRSQLARASGVGNQKIDLNRSDSEIDIDGIKSEMAVAKVFELEYDPFHFGVDTGVDLWSGDISIDVKSTRHDNGHLIFKNTDAFKSNVAILCVVKGITVKVCGGIERVSFKKNHKRIKFNSNYPSCPAVTQEELQPVEDIWRLMIKSKFATEGTALYDYKSFPFVDKKG